MYISSYIDLRVSCCSRYYCFFILLFPWSFPFARNPIYLAPSLLGISCTALFAPVLSPYSLPFLSYICSFFLATLVFLSSQTSSSTSPVSPFPYFSLSTRLFPSFLCLPLFRLLAFLIPLSLSFPLLPSFSLSQLTFSLPRLHPLPRLLLPRLYESKGILYDIGFWPGCCQRAEALGLSWRCC